MSKKLNLPRINEVTISGRLTRDVDLRYTPSGTPTTNITVANDRSWRDSDGNWQSATNFLRVVLWTKTAEWATENLGKGSPVIVQGRMQTRSWQNKDGDNRSITEIVAYRIQPLEREYNPNQPQKSNNNNKDLKENEEEENIDDDIPF